MAATQESYQTQTHCPPLPHRPPHHWVGRPGARSSRLAHRRSCCARGNPTLCMYALCEGIGILHLCKYYNRYQSTCISSSMYVYIHIYHIYIYIYIYGTFCCPVSGLSCAWMKALGLRSSKSQKTPSRARAGLARFVSGITGCLSEYLGSNKDLLLLRTSEVGNSMVPQQSCT